MDDQTTAVSGQASEAKNSSSPSSQYVVMGQHETDRLLKGYEFDVRMPISFTHDLSIT